MKNLPGAFVLQQRDDFSCALLLQHVCYLFMMGKSALHNQYTGVWLPAEDLPHVGPALSPPLLVKHFFNLGGVTDSKGRKRGKGGEEMGEGDGESDGGWLADRGNSREREREVKRRMEKRRKLREARRKAAQARRAAKLLSSRWSPFKPGSRDLSSISLKEDRCSLFRPPAAEAHVYLEGDLGDFTVLASRANKTYGRLVGKRKLMEFVRTSSHTARKRLRAALQAGAGRLWEVEYEDNASSLLNHNRGSRSPTGYSSGAGAGNRNDHANCSSTTGCTAPGFETSRAFALVGRFDSHVGHFGVSASTLLEASQHLPWSWTSLNGSSISSGKGNGGSGGVRGTSRDRRESEKSESLFGLHGDGSGREGGRRENNEDDWRVDRRRRRRQLLSRNGSGNSAEDMGAAVDGKNPVSRAPANAVSSTGSTEEMDGRPLLALEVKETRKAGDIGQALSTGRRRDIKSVPRQGRHEKEGKRGSIWGKASDREGGELEWEEEYEEEEDGEEIRRREREMIGLDLQGRPYALFFPSEKLIKANWTASLGRLLLGPLSAAVAGNT